MTTIDAELDALLDSALPDAARATTLQSQNISNRDLYYIQELIENGGHPRQAALIAGFSESVSAQAASWIRAAREDSKKPLLWDLYIEHKNKRLSNLDVTENRILTEYARLAFFDPSEMFNDDGTIKNIKDMSVDTRRALKDYDVVDNEAMGRIIKIKFADKRGALDSLARIMGMNNDKLNVSLNLADLLRKVTAVAAEEPFVVDITPEEDE